MNTYALLLSTAAAAAGSLAFSTLTYSLRETSRGRLAATARELGTDDTWIDAFVQKLDDHVFATAILRFVCNIILLTLMLSLAERVDWPAWAQTLAAVVLTLVVGLLVAVAFPHALARNGGDAIVLRSHRVLELLRAAIAPAARLMRLTDRLVGRLLPASRTAETAEIEQEILSMVEEGQKERRFNDDERSMIESVIEFRDTTAAQIMTPRPQVIGLDAASSLDAVKNIIEESGHSRLPVYNGTLDQIVGVLYARDLLRHLGLGNQSFDIRSVTRPALYVPGTKPLRDLLHEFRVQKVHMAIVLDEYGGTSGLVTIEDVLEELVGDISDEHEPAEPAMFKRLADQVWEADARAALEEVNRILKLDLPEDDGYETLAGFVSTTLGRIPQTGTSFEHAGAHFTVLEAEPNRVNRVRIELPSPTADVRV